MHPKRHVYVGVHNYYSIKYYMQFYQNPLYYYYFVFKPYKVHLYFLCFLYLPINKTLHSYSLHFLFGVICHIRLLSFSFFCSSSILFFHFYCDMFILFHFPTILHNLSYIHFIVSSQFSRECLVTPLISPSISSAKYFYSFHWHITS